MHLLCSSFCVHPQIHSLSSLTLFYVWGGPCSLTSSCFWLAGSGTVRNSGLDYLPPSLFRPQRTIRHLQVSWFPLCTRKSLSTMVFSCFYFVDPQDNRYSHIYQMKQIWIPHWDSLLAVRMLPFKEVKVAGWDLSCLLALFTVDSCHLSGM